MYDDVAKKIYRLQKNLPIIRNLAGWTAEDLGQHIGVTRQTITNIEKSADLAMTKTQYIAIRAVLECEIAQSQNGPLADALAILVDADDMNEEQEKEVAETVETIEELKPRRVNDQTVLKKMVALSVAVIALGGLAVLAKKRSQSSSVPKWLLDAKDSHAKGNK